MRISVFIFMVICLGSCAAPQRKSGLPLAAAGIAPVAALAQRIGGGEFEAAFIIPQGTDPHSFSLRASDAALLERAALVISVHSSIDGAILRGGANERILFGREAHREIAEAHAGHGHGGENAHYWLSLEHSKDMAWKIAALFSSLKPQKTALFESNARAFAAEIDTLGSQLRAKAPANGVSVLQQHPAWDYFLEELGIKNLGSVALFEGDQISPARLAKTIALIKSQPRPLLIDDIFTAPSPVLEVLRRETGARYYSFNPMAADNKEADIPSILRSYGTALLAE